MHYSMSQHFTRYTLTYSIPGESYTVNFTVII